MSAKAVICSFIEEFGVIQYQSYSSSVAGWTIDRVVGTSKFQITKPDALFVVFLGIKWAYDFVKKNRS